MLQKSLLQLLQCHCLLIFLESIPSPTIEAVRFMIDILDISVYPHKEHLGMF